jgi:hypothetical protein
MRRISGSIFAGVLAFAFLAPSTALADDADYTKDNWPLRVVDRPLTLDKGMLEIRGDTLMINMSSDAVAKPLSIAPDVFYGVSRKLSVGITHGTGICLSGTDNGCAKAYNDVGVEALYSLMSQGNFQVAGRGGLQAVAIDPFAMGLNIGVRGRLNAGNLAIVFDPGLYVGFTERDLLKEFVTIPVQVQFQVNEQTNVYALSGINGPLDGFGDAMTIPVGAGASFAVNNRLDFGGEFQFTNLAGKNSSADGRLLIARAALRL